MTPLIRVLFTQLILRRLFRKDAAPLPVSGERVHCAACNSDWKPGTTSCPGCLRPL